MAWLDRSTPAPGSRIGAWAGSCSCSRQPLPPSEIKVDDTINFRLGCSSSPRGIDGDSGGGYEQNLFGSARASPRGGSSRPM